MRTPSGGGLSELITASTAKWSDLFNASGPFITSVFKYKVQRLEVYYQSAVNVLTSMDYSPQNDNKQPQSMQQEQSSIVNHNISVGWPTSADPTHFIAISSIFLLPELNLSIFFPEKTWLFYFPFVQPCVMCSYTPPRLHPLRSPP